MEKRLTMEYAELTVDIYKYLYQLEPELCPYYSWFIGERYGIYIELYPELCPNSEPDDHCFCH